MRDSCAVMQLSAWHGHANGRPAISAPTRKGGCPRERGLQHGRPHAVAEGAQSESLQGSAALLRSTGALEIRTYLGGSRLQLPAARG